MKAGRFKMRREDIYTMADRKEREDRHAQSALFHPMWPKCDGVHSGLLPVGLQAPKLRG